MFASDCEIIEADRAAKYFIRREGRSLTYVQVLELWAGDESFRTFFSSLLADSSFSAFRWETPALTTETANQPFEFVLLNADRFAKRRTDARTYAEYFTDDGHGIVTFPSLGGDATLIVPSPRTTDDAYGHLAAFIRNAPAKQIDALWRVVAETVTPRINETPIWLSTAGGGVAWLHIRIDSRPKYYGHAPYKRIGS